MQDHQDYMVAENMLLLEQAMAALEKTTGIEGRLMAMEPVAGLDATVELKMEGERHRYVVEIKRVDRFAAIGQVKNQLESFMMPGLLVAPRITAETADKCREFGLQFRILFLLLSAGLLPVQRTPEPGGMHSHAHQ